MEKDVLRNNITESVIDEYIVTALLPFIRVLKGKNFNKKDTTYILKDQFDGIGSTENRNRFVLAEIENQFQNTQSLN